MLGVAPVGSYSLRALFRFVVDAATGPFALMLNVSGRPLLHTANKLVVLHSTLASTSCLSPGLSATDLPGPRY